MQRPLTGKSALNKLGMVQQVMRGLGLRFAPPDWMLQDVAERGRCSAPLTRPITEQEKCVCCIWAHNVSAVSGAHDNKTAKPGRTLLAWTSYPQIVSWSLPMAR